jgi:hypothetical protein
VTAPNQSLDGKYTLKLAKGLIYTCYKQAGIDGELEGFEQSPLQAELGQIKAGWNEGLFRYLDETINLLNTAEYAILTAAISNEDKSYFTLVVLLHQIKSNLSAVRVLSSLGLDSQARLALRALYENGIALCRAVIDPDFREKFRNVRTFDDTNEFWHTHISKSKTEKFLKKYNDENQEKCHLVSGDTFEQIYKNLGTTAHPNFLFSHFEYVRNHFGENAKDGFFAGSEAATEFVLTNANHIAFAVVNFLWLKREPICGDSKWVRLGRFYQIEENGKVIDAVGRICGLMQLLLMKWSNRQKADFDPDVRF